MDLDLTENSLIKLIPKVSETINLTQRILNLKGLQLNINHSFIEEIKLMVTDLKEIWIIKE